MPADCARFVKRRIPLQRTANSELAALAKLSVSGVGLRSHTGVAIRMFESLSRAGINLDLINTSEVRVNVIVDGKQGAAALQRLQSAFADVHH